MVRLVAETPAAGLLPVEIGDCRLSDVDPGAIVWVAPFGAHPDLPGPNEVREVAGRRWIWVGPGQALVLGKRLAGVEDAAMADQSDGWVVLRLEGASARDVLARLTPLDLRGAAPGQTARTLLGHMTVSLTRVGENAFEIMAFRSMAQTAVHDLSRAMRQVAARG